MAAVRVVLIASLLGVFAAGCSDDGPVISQQPATDRTTTTQLGATPGGGDGALAGDPLTIVAERLAAVDTGAVVMGSEFNKRLLTVQFLAFGLTQSEAECVASAVASQAGASFDTQAVNQIGQSTPPQELFLGCIDASRISQLGQPDPSRIPAASLRPLLTELSAAGFRTGGLTEEEAGCVGAQVIAGVSDQDLGRIGNDTAGVVGVQQIKSALMSCVTPLRLSQLAVS